MIDGRDPSRRELLGGLLLALTGDGCGGDPPPPTCVARVVSSRPSYCLVEARVLRVPGARQLAAGGAVLLNVDDNTAVVVARDAGGYYALSAICTHQCCLLSVCDDAACGAPAPNPGECRATAKVTPSAAGVALICPCHASGFRLDGTVASGPATRSLPHFALTFERDDALVDTSADVRSDQRAS